MAKVDVESKIEKVTLELTKEEFLTLAVAMGKHNKGYKLFKALDEIVDRYDLKETYMAMRQGRYVWEDAEDDI